MSEDARARGRRVRGEVLGERHVARAEEETTAFSSDFQDLLTRYAWGEIWSRPEIGRAHV